MKVLLLNYFMDWVQHIFCFLVVRLELTSCLSNEGTIDCYLYPSFLQKLTVRLTSQMIKGSNLMLVLLQLKKVQLLVQQDIPAVPALLQVRSLRRCHLGVGVATAQSVVL